METFLYTENQVILEFLTHIFPTFVFFLWFLQYTEFVTSSPPTNTHGKKTLWMFICWVWENLHTPNHSYPTCPRTRPFVERIQYVCNIFVYLFLRGSLCVCVMLCMTTNPAAHRSITNQRLWSVISIFDREDQLLNRHLSKNTAHSNHVVVLVHLS